MKPTKDCKNSFTSPESEKKIPEGQKKLIQAGSRPVTLEHSMVQFCHNQLPENSVHTSDYSTINPVVDIKPTLVNFNTSPGQKTKNLEELFSEIEETNPRFKIHDMSYLRECFENIKSEYSLWRRATKADMTTWAGQIRKNTSPAAKIAYVWKAMELASLYKVRDVQVLSVMMTYYSERGEIAQVNTGEGKTIIIAMLTALLCLDGNKVDMVTTSPELAVPQSVQLEPFYKLLGLSSSNIDKGKKSDAYKCNVVYGSINEFEGDVLHDEFLKEGTRAGRPYDIVIVDEADSMLVDGINNMTRLSSPMPGMNTLLPILVIIWDLFVQATTSKMVVDTEEEEEAIEKVFGISAIEEVETKVRLLIESGGVSVPKHLKNFVLLHQLSIWVQNANKARYHLKRDREYVIRDNEVKIVDLHNSGIVFKNMKWSDGLHQFLQIKNKVPLTCEDLVTNYIANPTFFSKYKQIFGFTGTLGCIKTRAFLGTSYNSGTIIIPPFKVKQHTKFSPIIAKSKAEWYRAIVDSCIHELNYERVVLIIADSIAETNEINDHFVSHRFDSSRILMYQTENDSKIAQELIQPGHVIITTNICGRGVNIFPSDNARGGLHICLTFLPENSRVEDQNIGRTSRSGNPGTSQMILLDSKSGSLEEVKSGRDENNERKLDLMGKDMTRSKVKAEIFKKFCAFLNIIDGTSPTPDHWEVQDNYAKGLETEEVCDAIKEKFSIWLKERESFHEKNPGDLLRQYTEFEDSIIHSFRPKNPVTENVFFFIRSGTKLLLKSDYNAAIEQYNKAILIDEKCSVFAYLNRASAHVSLQKYHEALGDLETAKYGISALLNEIQELWGVATNHSEALQDKFKRQHKLLKNTLESIESVLNTHPLNKKPIPVEKKKTFDLVFVKWNDKLSADEEKEYRSDAIELAMRGWIGPVKIAYRDVGTSRKLGWKEYGRELFAILKK